MSLVSQSCISNHSRACVWQERPQVCAAARDTLSHLTNFAIERKSLNVYNAVLLMPFALPCREVYDAAQTRYRGRATAPLLIDKRQRALISNESADIVRMLNSVSLPGCTDIDLYPASLQAEIDEVNDLVYNKVRHCRSTYAACCCSGCVSAS